MLAAAKADSRAVTRRFGALAKKIGETRALASPPYQGKPRAWNLAETPPSPRAFTAESQPLRPPAEAHERSVWRQGLFTGSGGLIIGISVTGAG